MLVAHLREDATVGSNHFVKCSCNCRRTALNRPKILGKAAADRRNCAPRELANQAHEIVPYEVFWEIVLENLEE